MERTHHTHGVGTTGGGNADWIRTVGQQLQVANQQIVLCQQKIQKDGDSPDKQLLLQNALGAVAKAWETVEQSSASSHSAF